MDLKYFWVCALTCADYHTFVVTQVDKTLEVLFEEMLHILSYVTKPGAEAK